jgi:hypothetical protein
MTFPRASFLESPWVARLALFGAMALALLFRLPGIEWGLPLKYAHIDEAVVINYSLRIVGGALNPDFYDYPGFFLYLLAGLLRLGALIHGWFFGAGLDSLVGDYLAGDASFFILIARGLTVAFALLTVATMVSLGRSWSRWGIGFCAAVLLCINALHIRSSHYGLIDVAAVFFTLWAMGKIVQFGVAQGWREGAEAAFLVGLATATKYYPGILLLPLALLPFTGKHPQPVRMVTLLLGMAFAGLFLGSPYTVLSLGEFVSRFNHLAPKIVGAPGHSVPFLPTVINLWQNAGPLAVLSGAAGIYFSLREKGAWRLFAVLWLVLFVFLGFWVHQPPHYSLALYPPLFLFGVHAADQIPWRRPLPVVILTGMLVVFSLPFAVGEVRYLRRPDTRLQAADWVRGHVPPGSKILRFSHTPDFKRSDPFLITVDFLDKKLAWIGQDREDVAKGIQTLREFDYLIVSGEIAEPAGRHFGQSFLLMKRFADPLPSGYHNPVLSIYKTHPAQELP